MLNFSDNILFTTYLVPNSNPKPNEWWYYGPDHGQHVSLFTEKSLNLLAHESLDKDFSYKWQKHSFVYQPKIIFGII